MPISYGRLFHDVLLFAHLHSKKNKTKIVIAFECCVGTNRMFIVHNNETEAGNISCSWGASGSITRHHLGRVQQ